MPIATNPRAPRANRLLEKLPDEDYAARRLPVLEFVNLAVGEILYHSGDEITYLYFPTTAIVSLLYTTENGATAEMGMAGRCGALGIALFMGGRTTPNQAIVQIAAAHAEQKRKLFKTNSRGAALCSRFCCATRSR